jgi:hypothetical protein
MLLLLPLVLLLLPILLLLFRRDANASATLEEG